MITDIHNLFPSLLLGIEDLGILTGRISWRPGRPVAVDGENWLRLLRPFSAVARFHVAGKFATAIMHALQQAEGEPDIVLRTLRELYVVMESEPHCDWGPLRTALRSFTASRQLSGRPIDVKYGEISCEYEYRSYSKCRSGTPYIQYLSLHLCVLRGYGI